MNSDPSTTSAAKTSSDPTPLPGPPVIGEGAMIQGLAVPDDVVGSLAETRWPDEQDSLKARLVSDGYVLLRGAIDLNAIMSARDEVFERLIEVGEIQPPAIEGIATGTSRRLELHPDRGAFWQSVSEGQKLRAVSHEGRIKAIMGSLFGEEARPHDYIFLRPGVVGRATKLHYDLPFFARGSNRIVTAWTAIGDIPVCEGPLMVVEGSHRFDDLIDPIREIDYNSKESPQVQLMGDAVEFARSRGTRLLTTDFRAGDVIIFSMTTLHGTLDNHSAMGRTRLSCDVRWQPVADPVDERYVGPNPPGTTGVGYGELNGAKPLTEDWHTR